MINDHFGVEGLFRNPGQGEQIKANWEIALPLISVMTIRALSPLSISLDVSASTGKSFDLAIRKRNVITKPARTVRAGTKALAMGWAEILERAARPTCYIRDFGFSLQKSNRIIFFVNLF